MEFLTGKQILFLDKIEENEEEGEEDDDDDVEGEVGIEDLFVFTLQIHFLETVRDLNPTG